jgi:hypothetical protein
VRDSRVGERSQCHHENVANMEKSYQFPKPCTKHFFHHIPFHPCKRVIPERRGHVATVLPSWHTRIMALQASFSVLGSSCIALDYQIQTPQHHTVYPYTLDDRRKCSAKSASSRVKVLASLSGLLTRLSFWLLSTSLCLNRGHWLLH